MPVSYSGTAITWPDSSTTTSGWTGFKNRIINGAMMIDQRNAGASFSATNGAYSLDRWQCISYTGGATTGKYTVQRNAGSVTPPAGFINYLGVTSTAATSSSATDIYLIVQYIEGFNCADLGWGTANAQTVTVSFRVRSSVTGTFGVTARNDNLDYNYPATYTINAANTWETKTITIPGPTSGTWLTNNGIGIGLLFQLQVGSSFTAAANSWTTSGVYGATGCVNLLNTNGATFYITGVQLERGSTASSFEYRPYGTELALCQRYCNVYATSSNSDMFCIGYNNSTSVSAGILQLPVEMRSAPSVTFNQSASYYGVYAVPYNTISCSAVAILNQATTKTVGIQFTSSGLTAGYGTLFKNAGSGAANITISAEL